MPLRVLFLYDVPAPLRARLAERLGDSVELHYAASDHPLDDADLRALAAEADVLIGWKPTAKFLAQCGNAKLFHLPWAGATPLIGVFREANALRAERGLPPLPLANNHGVANATAQHTVAMLLALTNQLLPHHQWMQSGQWRRGDSAARTVPLRADVTVGLLGYGAINQRVHALLEPFGVKCIALSRGGSPLRPAEGWGCTAPPLLDHFTPHAFDAFLRATDILVIAVPHTPETEGLIGARELAMLGTDRVTAAGSRRHKDETEQPNAAGAAGMERPGKSGLPFDRESTPPAAEERPLGGLPLLVNVARGPVVDEAALYHALASGQLAGAALDVWYDYSPAADAEGRKYPWNDPAAHPFHELPNVLLSPHRAASPLDDLERWEPIIENLLRLARGEQPHSVVDLEAGY